MDINQVTQELDTLFAQEKVDEIPQYLESHIAQAIEEDAKDVLLTLYNEIIGFYRETGQYDQSIANCHKAIALMDDMGIQDTIPYATTLLNAANAHRAAGLLQESLELYNRVRPIYVAQLDEDDMYFANFYNNLSLLYQEMNDFASAKEQLVNALYIVTHKPDKQFEVAVTQANLANTCIELGQDEEAKARAEEAIRIFEELGVDDAHYSAALSALGSLYYMDKDYASALSVMEKSRDCVAKYLGKDNIQYQRLSDNIGIIENKINEAALLAEEAGAPETAGTEEVQNADIGTVGTESSSSVMQEFASSESAFQGTESSSSAMQEFAPSESAFQGAMPSASAAQESAPSESVFQGTESPSSATQEFAPSESAFQGAMPLESAYQEPAPSSSATQEFAPAESAFQGAMSSASATQEPASSESAFQGTEFSSSATQEFAPAESAFQGAMPLESAYQEPAPSKSAFQGPSSDEGAVNSDDIWAQQPPAAETTGLDKGTAEAPGMGAQGAVSGAAFQKSETVPAEVAAAAPNQGLPAEARTQEAQMREAQGREADSELTKRENATVTGLELCRLYYEAYGKPMIASKFRAYESVIAVGLVGKGSDCFGYDDAISRDHDYGPRFVMWVTKKVYEQIGEELQEAYDQLPRSFMGVDRLETFHGRDRCGVMIIEDFYKGLLGYNLVGMLAHNQENLTGGKESMDTIKSWLAVHDYALAAAVNGEVFRDDEGIFTMYRDMLKEYYPKAVWYRKIAQTCALFSQSGQYNLPRMRTRGQLVAAELAKAECAKQAMKLYYLLNRTYAPHDKWLFKGMPENSQMTICGENGEQLCVAALVERVSLLPVDEAHEAELTAAIESLAVIFANELEKRDMVGKCDLYLDACTKELTAKSDALLTAIVANTPVITALALSIAKAEFEAFDKVQNEGGRAGCQNNWPTFKVMRMSQYMTWTEDMLLQYLFEFKTNYANGRNMIEEKYARMMESTAPLEYACFADQLPPIPEEKRAVMEQVIALQVKWMEEFAAAYPRLADDARRIHTSEDLPDDTSYETYLRGELGTYSDRMLEMYGRYIVAHAQKGRNVAREIMENTVHFYGYQDLDAASNAKMK